MLSSLSSIVERRLHLIRHGESFNNTLYSLVRQKLGDNQDVNAYNALESTLRDPDSALSEKGIKQAALLRDFISAGSFELTNDNFVVFTSPMRRCLDTTAIISRGLPNIHNKIFIKNDMYEEGGCFKHVDGGAIGLRGASSSDMEMNYPDFTCLQGDLLRYHL